MPLLVQFYGKNILTLKIGYTIYYSANSLWSQTFHSLYFGHHIFEISFTLQSADSFGLWGLKKKSYCIILVYVSICNLRAKINNINYENIIYYIDKINSNFADEIHHTWIKVRITQQFGIIWGIPNLSDLGFIALKMIIFKRFKA